MNKLMDFVCIIFLSFLYVGTKKYSNDPLFWLATGSPIYQYIREALGLILMIQLLTRPPRHLLFRVFTGGISLVVAFWAIYETLTNQMLILDTLTFLAASISIGIIALEGRAKRISANQRNKLA